MRTPRADRGSPPPGEVTRLLKAWTVGDPAAMDALIPIVYQELRRLARRRMRSEGAGHTLQTTALVHEAYLRLVGAEVEWRDRGHFFAIAARQMRRILVDFARRRRAEKRGGAQPAFSLARIDVAEDPRPELVALDDALRGLERFDPRKGQVVELRFFAGLTIAETAEVLGVAHATVERDLKVARAWLGRELAAGAGAG